MAVVIARRHATALLCSSCDEQGTVDGKCTLVLPSKVSARARPAAKMAPRPPPPTPRAPSPQWTACSSPVLSMMQARVVDRHNFQVEYPPFFGTEPSDDDAAARAAWHARIAANAARKKYVPQRHDVEERLALGSQTFDAVPQATRKEYTSMAATQAGLDAQATIGAAGDAALLLEPKDGFYRSETIVLHAPDCLECRLAAHAGALLIAAVKAGEPPAVVALAAAQAAQAVDGEPGTGPRTARWCAAGRQCGCRWRGRSRCRRRRRGRRGRGGR